MATSAGIPGLPASGTFPVKLSGDLADGFAPGRKRRRHTEEVVAFKYTFKPASITPDTSGRLEIGDRGQKELVFDTQVGGRQVFDAREEPTKSRECVLIWDEDTHTFTLHPLSTTLTLTLNRTSSSHPRGPSSIASSSASSSSASIPLSRRPRPETTADDEEGDSRSSGEMRHEVSSVLGIEDAASPTPKKPPARSRVSGKGLPRKMPVPAPTPTRGRGKGGAKKVPPPAPAPAGKRGTTAGGKKGAAAKPVPSGKIKSAEIIEDSDEEAGMAEGGGDDEDDEFKRMMEESLLGGGGGGDGGADDSEEDDEEEDDDDEEEEDELGGAKLVVQDQGRGTGVIDDHSEWL